MLDKIIETYRCLISCREKMPGMRLEDAFSDTALEQIKEEHEWLKRLSDKRTTEKKVWISKG